jgi:hypothetical protein
LFTCSLVPGIIVFPMPPSLVELDCLHAGPASAARRRGAL